MRRLTMIAMAVVCCLVATRPAAADATLFRLYLTDGTTLLTYGEYVRVEDRVIFSMLAGGAPGDPRIQAVTIPAGIVDWTRTDRFATSARYQEYARTRGEEDFGRLSNEIAGVLNDILLTPDRARALTIAQQARATLNDWPREHYGYRQRDVQEIVSLLDEAISGLRAATGQSSFEVSLVASAPEIDLLPLADAPPLYDQIAQVFRVATFSGRSAERVALLHVALVMLNEAGGAIDATDAAIWRKFAETQVRQEMEIDERYTALAGRLTRQASQAAARAQVTTVQRVLDRIAREDVRLGEQRPEIVAALRTSVEVQLAAARELRLRRDQWTIRRGLYRTYQRSVSGPLLQLVKAQSALEAIRRLDGPSPSALAALRDRMRGGTERLERINPPSDLRSAHDMIIGAWRFAEAAVNGRFTAAASASLPGAWEASSAAAGALMLLSRAQQEIRTLLDPPRLQ